MFFKNNVEEEHYHKSLEIFVGKIIFFTIKHKYKSSLVVVENGNNINLQSNSFKLWYAKDYMVGRPHDGRTEKLY